MAASTAPAPKSLPKKIIHEVKLVWIMTTYFAAGFGLLLLMQNLLLAHRGEAQIGYIGVVILAALIGKVIIVIEKMAFVNRFRHRRRLGHIIYSTIIFTVISQLVGVIEKVIKNLIHGEAFEASVTHAIAATSGPILGATTIAMLILFGVLFFVREVNLLLGEGVLVKALFQRPEPE